MISFCGYNFCQDMNAIDPMTTNLNNITNTKIQNGAFNHIDITRDVTISYNTTIPNWNYNTILDCNFDNNINGGNVDFTLSQVNKIRIKRRKKGTFNWTLIREIPIKTTQDLLFTITDFYCPNGEEFEYAIVPTLNKIEGNYIINSINSSFNGVFICDNDSIIKLFEDVSYGDTSNIQEVGILQPIGAKYATVISNSETDYQNGSISGKILGVNFRDNRKINRGEVVSQTNNIIKILKNKKPKIIKDWNGNIWLVIIVDNPMVSYVNEYGMGVTNISFNWIEQGKYDNEEDLIRNGLI